MSGTKFLQVNTWDSKVLLVGLLLDPIFCSFKVCSYRLYSM